jgi:hypothetical protein
VGGSNVSGSGSVVDDDDEEAVGYSSGLRGGVFVSKDSGE